MKHIFMIVFLWTAASVGLTVGLALVVDAVVYFWRKPCE